MNKKEKLKELLKDGLKFRELNYKNASPAIVENMRIWFNDVNIFAKNELNENELRKEISSVIFFKDSNGFHQTYEELIALLLSLDKMYESTSTDKLIIENNTLTKKVFSKHRKKYDVFISHANKDKLTYVNELCETIKRLGINVFYDTNVLSWGDKWKEKILEGTAESEFAIIVISKNFFDREWTERELNEFLNRQNQSGQKIILPLLHEINLDELKAKYPALGEIQAIHTQDYNKEQICILFAKEYIKRLNELI